MSGNKLISALFGRPVLALPERIEFAGKAGPIVITHNQQGIPTIRAVSALDAICGQGCVAAIHRPFQIEMNRRTAAARLSEVSGPVTLEVDRWICRLGIPEAVEASYNEIAGDTALMEVLQRYSDGVNMAWERFPAPSFEFALLGIQPEPWTPRDCLRIVELMSWSLAGNWEEQLVRVQLIEALGAEQATLLESEAWSSLPASTAPMSEETLAWLSAAGATFLRQYQEIRAQAQLLGRRSGSNSFAVSGTHTESGKPILAGDPHLALGLPGWFYQCVLHAAQPTPGFGVPLHAAGAGIAGTPGIITGRNRQFAWSVTAVMAITSSLCLEQPGVPTRPVTHTIAVKKKPAVEETVLWTERGPLLKLPAAPDGQALSLRWVGHRGDAGGTARAVWNLPHATSVDQIRTAASYWSAPAMNFCWAEVEKPNGSFGWRVVGRFPRWRTPGGGLLPAPGWLPEQQWQDLIPANELPEEVNPARGYFVSANQRHAPAGYPYPLSHEYMPPYRAQRIQQLIEQTLAQGNYTRDSARRIQLDQTSLAALEIHKLILRFVSTPQTELERNALNLLQKWDGTMAARSSAAALVKVTESHLFTGVARQLFGANTELSEAWLGLGHTPLAASTMAHWRLHEIIFGLMHAQKTCGQLSAENWPALFQQAFSAAVAELKTLQGSQPESWSWGNLHQLEILHPLIQQPIYKELPPLFKVLKRFLRLARGPFPLGGDEHTPWQAGALPVPLAAQQHPRRFWPNAYQPGVRAIAVDGQKLYTCLPGGISGQTTHPWADNQLSAYLNGQLYELSLE